MSNKNQSVRRNTRAQSQTEAGQEERKMTDQNRSMPPPASDITHADLVSCITAELSKQLQAMENKMSSRIGDLAAKVTNNQSELKTLIETRSNKLRSDIQMELSQITNKIGGINSRLTALEANLQGKPFDCEKTVIMFNIMQPADESNASLLATVENIISTGLDLPGLEIVAVKRCGGQPGPVKVELSNEHSKIELLKQKRKLKSKQEFSNIFIRSSKTHEGRLLELNMKTLLRELDMAQVFTFTANGRMVKRDETYTDGAHRGRGRGRGRGQMRGSFQSNRGTFNADYGAGSSLFIDGTTTQAGGENQHPRREFFD